MQRFPLRVLHHPNQLKLAEILIDHLSHTSACVFQTHTVVVQTIGMATWLRQKIAQQNGICANIHFILPREYFFNALIENAKTSITDSIIADQTHLLWKLLSIIPVKIEQGEFGLLKQYCTSGDSIDSTKLYKLSHSLATLYDKYSVHRADTLHFWETADLKAIYSLPSTEKIQALLWRQLRKDSPNLKTWSDLLKSFIKSPSKTSSELQIFGVTNLPPIFVDILHALSKNQSTKVYWQNPVKINDGYWEDELNHREWILENISSHSFQQQTNPLLASFGRIGREFISILYTGTNSSYEIENSQLPLTKSSPTTLLELIHSDIHLNRYSPGVQYVDDQSIEISSSYSPIREVEALRIYLLNYLHRSPDTDIADILVLVPKIESYAPAIEAVFGSISSHQNDYLPFHVSDRTSPSDEPIIQLFLNLLKLDQFRFTANEVLAFIEIPSFAQTFQIDPESIAEIKRFISHAGISWGIDQQQVRNHTESDYQPFHTWRQGLEKLILGFMVESPCETPTLWNGIVASTLIQETDLPIIYSLLDIIDTLEQLKAELQKTHTISAWTKLSRRWIKQLFSNESENARPIQKILIALETIDSSAAQSGYEEKLSNSLFHSILTDHLALSESSHGFLSGSITFCELKPMRSIPHKVVCLLGMNYGEFPRSAPSSNLDLTMKKRRVGDRSPRDDDQYAFLEAILSAQERLYLSYIGQSEKTNSSLPPAAPLQLLISRYSNLQNQLIEHPLHRHDPFYFDSDHPRSPNLNDLNLASNDNKTIEPSVPPLTFQKDDSDLTLNLEAFIQRFTQPSKSQIQGKIKARLPWNDHPLTDHELFSLSGLDNYKLLQELSKLKSEDCHSYQILLQKNLIPYGYNGKHLFDTSSTTLTSLHEKIQPQAEISLNIKLTTLNITGMLHPQKEDQTKLQLVYYKKKPTASDRIDSFLKGCLLAKSLNTEISVEVLYLEPVSPKKNAVKQIKLDQAESALTVFEQIYLQSLQQPIPLLNESLHAYNTTIENDSLKDHETHTRIFIAKKAAYQKAWKSDPPYKRGEEEKLENLLLFDYSVPYDTTFVELAKTLQPYDL